MHLGNVTGGHYYAYIRDFATNQWFKFNDEQVTGPLERSEWEDAFGGYTYRNGYDVAADSAYMLLYRRREPTVNIDAVPEDCIPRQILEEIADEQAAAREAALAKEAEEERRRAAVPFGVCHGEQMKILWVKEMLSWEEALQQVHRELNLDSAPESIRLVRLDPTQSLTGPLRETSGSVPVEFECDSDTLVKDVPHLRAAICQVAIGDLPSLTDTAHIHYGEKDANDVSRHLACAVGTPFKTVVEQISDSLHMSENEAVQLYNKFHHRVSGLALRKQCGHYMITPQWMREALTDVIGLGAAERLCELVSSQEVRLVSVRVSRSVSLDDARRPHTRNFADGCRAVVRRDLFHQLLGTSDPHRNKSVRVRALTQEVTLPLIAQSLDKEMDSSSQVQLCLEDECADVSHTGDPRWTAHS